MPPSGRLSAPPLAIPDDRCTRMTSIDQRIAQEFGVYEQQVTAAVALLDGGATVPFIARYRKEATGALDDGQLRTDFRCKQLGSFDRHVPNGDGVISPHHQPHTLITT